jgi:DNA-binding transcriptional LysR family regulator
MNPALQIQLVVLPRVINLSKREADIAISITPPNQLRQIVRRITDFEMSLYATDSYLASAPAIESTDDLRAHRFVSYITDQLFEPDLDNLATLGIESVASFESTSVVAQLEATAGGAGLCVLPDFIAAMDKRLTRVLPETVSLKRQFWLSIHPEVVNLARVRAVIDFICESVRSDRALFLNRSPLSDNEDDQS